MKVGARQERTTDSLGDGLDSFAKWAEAAKVDSFGPSVDWLQHDTSKYEVGQAEKGVVPILTRERC